jgi:hypothetical protein
MDPDLADAQIAALEALLAETEREAERVGVEWDVAAPVLRELAASGTAPPARNGENAEDSVAEVELGLDAHALRDVLRTLPDGAGTARFLAAFRAREPGPTPPTT